MTVNLIPLPLEVIPYIYGRHRFIHPLFKPYNSLSSLLIPFSYLIPLLFNPNYQLITFVFFYHYFFLLFLSTLVTFFPLHFVPSIASFFFCCFLSPIIFTSAFLCLLKLPSLYHYILWFHISVMMVSIAIPIIVTVLITYIFFYYIWCCFVTELTRYPQQCC